MQLKKKHVYYCNNTNAKLWLPKSCDGSASCTLCAMLLRKLRSLITFSSETNWLKIFWISIFCEIALHAPLNKNWTEKLAWSGTKSFFGRVKIIILPVLYLRHTSSVRHTDSHIRNTPTSWLTLIVMPFRPSLLDSITHYTSFFYSPNNERHTEKLPCHSLDSKVCACVQAATSLSFGPTFRFYNTFKFI